MANITGHLRHTSGARMRDGCRFAPPALAPADEADRRAYVVRDVPEINAGITLRHRQEYPAVC